MAKDPKKILESALQGLGFKHVVYVDDAFDRDALDVESLIVWLGLERNRDASKGILKSQDVRLDPEDGQFTAQIRAFVDDEGSASKVKAIRKSIDLVLDSETDGTEEDGEKRFATDRIILTTFSEIMKLVQGVSFTPLGLQGWADQRNALAEQAKTERTLFVFDQELSEHELGAQEIEALDQTLNGSDAVYVLLSYKVEHNQEHEETRRLRKNGLAITAIPKRDVKVTGSEEFLILRIRAAILAKKADPILSAFRRAMSTSCTAVATRVEELTGLEFDELVMRSSCKEGVHELDTLIRIYSNGFAGELRKALRGKAKLHSAIASAREYSFDPKTSIPRIGDVAWRLYREEFYESGEYINDCNAPLEVGDIFQLVGQNDQSLGTFVLIAQPCDMMVRENGRRRANDILLGKIENREPLKFDNGTLKEKKAFDLPFFQDSGKCSMIDFSEVFRIDGRLLDLCCLQDSGVAEIGAWRKLKGLTPGWERRWQMILKPFVIELQNSLELAGQVIVAETLPEHIVLLNGHSPVKIAVVRHGRRKVLAVGIKRTQRLSSAMAAEMLRGFADYLSRPARPHALTEVPKSN